MLGRQTVGVIFAVALLTATMGTGSSAGAAGTLAAPPDTPDASGTVWLCRPGLVNNPCTVNLDTTVVPARGPSKVRTAEPATNPAFDCFYIYPTVSRQRGDNANLDIKPAELGAVVAQASQFSRLCDVWAPIYRQRTAASLAKGFGNDPSADEVAHRSLLAGWNDYLANDNHGRPIIFVGHSQGAAMLIRLLRSVVDPNPTLRHQMVSAIIAGGNVVVPTGKGNDGGGSFAHLMPCTSTGETGCVIAYSSFPGAPPANSYFGRAGQGVSLQSGQTQRRSLAVVCTNPAALGGGAANLTPYFIATTTSFPTLWLTYPNLYRAACPRAGGATWLQVTTIGGRRDPRPRISASQGAAWGYHASDINLALGGLLRDVAAEEASYQSANH